MVTRLADGSGVVSFAGAAYGCGRAWARQSIDVTIVAGSVQLSQGGKVIRVHPIRHDRSRELGAFANPNGRPPPYRVGLSGCRLPTGTRVSCECRTLTHGGGVAAR